ncbi:MAG TPA: lipoate--protein ligase family protein [Planctomycetota bacterium]|nr:lipoate--protein ligase family protein [Planctomycetota bacterium]
MRLLDVSLADPAANLALDEAILRLCDSETLEGTEPPRGYLRFWESPTHFVVLGVSGRLDEELDLETCRRDGLPILRRGSGGGTVLQGPGCLNFAVVLPFERDPRLRDLERSYEIVVGGAAAALGIEGVARRGRSDLAFGDRKIGGSAQKRTPRAILHHGTILYDFDLDLIARYLREPRKQPDYREKRHHLAFVTNLGVESTLIRARLARAFEAEPLPPGWPIPDLKALIEERYGNPAWIERW